MALASDLGLTHKVVSERHYLASQTCKSSNGTAVIPTLKATGYGYGTYKNFYTTGHYPQVAVLEVWQRESPIDFRYQDIIDSAEKVDEKVTNASRSAILGMVKNLQPTRYLCLRMMTPKEQFRFMGVPEKYIDRLIKSGNADKELYKQAGNSIVVSVLYRIFTSLFNVN